jgi:hypothetical protein
MKDKLGQEIIETEEICLVCYDKKEDNGLIVCSNCDERISNQ